MSVIGAPGGGEKYTDEGEGIIRQMIQAIFPESKRLRSEVYKELMGLLGLKATYLSPSLIKFLNRRYKDGCHVSHL